jgi:hypothetical protein
MATWALCVDGPDVVCWKHVVDLGEWDIIPHKACAPGRFDTYGCILLVQTAEPKSVLAHGLHAGVALNKTQLLLLCQMKGINIPNNASKAAIVLQLVKSVFADKSDQDAALSKLNQPSCDIQVGEKIDPVLDELLEETAVDDANMDEQSYLKLAKKAKVNHTRKLEIKHNLQQSKLTAKSAAKSKAQARRAARQRPKIKAKAKAKAKASGKAKARARAKARATSSPSARANPQSSEVAHDSEMEDLFNEADAVPVTLPESEGAAPHPDDADIDAVLEGIAQAHCLDPSLVETDLFGTMDWNEPLPVQALLSTAAQQPRQGGHGGPRVYSSPVCLGQLCGPHGIIRLDCNAHRFIAECSIGHNIILMDQSPYHFKTSGQQFTSAGSWQESLIYAHKWLWTKYTILPQELRPTTPAGTVPQTPGVIPQAVMDDIAAHTIPFLPDIKKY